MPCNICIYLATYRVTVGELPYTALGDTYVYGDSNQIVGWLNGLGDGSHLTYRTLGFGSDEYHNNLPPCLPAYLWVRTN